MEADIQTQSQFESTSVLNDPHFQQNPSSLSLDEEELYCNIDY